MDSLVWCKWCDVWATEAMAFSIIPTSISASSAFISMRWAGETTSIRPLTTSIYQHSIGQTLRPFISCSQLFHSEWRIFQPFSERSFFNIHFKSWWIFLLSYPGFKTFSKLNRSISLLNFSYITAHFTRQKWILFNDSSFRQNYSILLMHRWWI